MDYQDQHADDLRLYVAGGFIDRNQFRQLVAQDKVIGSYFVEAAIVGASHCVRIMAGETIISEVLACVQAHGGYALTDETIGAVSSKTVVHEYQQLSYSCSISSLTLDDAQFVVADMESIILQNQGDMICLKFDFPTLTPDATAGKTLIIASLVENGKLSLRTAHSYPLDRRVVLTRTIIGDSR